MKFIEAIIAYFGRKKKGFPENFAFPGGTWYNAGDSEKTRDGGGVMEGLNSFQRKFMESLASVQEECVQTALARARKDSCPLEETLYDITSEVMIRILEIVDGYAVPDIGRLCVICEKTGESLKHNPEVELHDAVCGYLKGVD